MTLSSRSKRDTERLDVDLQNLRPDAWDEASKIGVDVVMFGVAGTVDGDFGSGEMFEIAAGIVGDAGVSDGVAADAELEDTVVV